MDPNFKYFGKINDHQLLFMWIYSRVQNLIIVNWTVILSWPFHSLSQNEIVHEKRWIETYFLSQFALLSSLSLVTFLPVSVSFPPVSLPLFLHAISPESCSSGCTSRPTKPINTVYVIDPSACLVYTVCARLRPKETLTFHTQDSPPSLSRIIVQLKSQSELIMWKPSLRKVRKKTLVCVWVGMMRENGMFSSDVHVHIVSSPLAEGLFIEATVCGRQRRRCAATVSWINCSGDLVTHCPPPGQLRSSKVVSEACL